MNPMLIALVASVLVVGACGNDSAEDAEPAATSTTQAAAQSNDADVAFVQGMIPHHQQAVEMAEMAETRAESDAVRELAARISDAQGPEIRIMQGWLEEWGVAQPDGDEAMGGMDHGSGDGMGGGMMDEEEMAALGGATGSTFDEMFLTMMIEHHEGAVDMATDQVEQGQNPEAVTLAEGIVQAQEAEITEMRNLLDPAG